MGKRKQWPFLAVSLATAFALNPGSRALAARPACPDTSIGETALDCPWAGVARDLERAASEGKDPAPLLKKELPSLARSLAADRNLRSWQALWGTSINYDEIVKKVIVQPKVLEAIARLFGAPKPAGRLAHAGMEHTYGYLFSVLRTPFGYKRARWVQGEIERGFGLPEKSLSPEGKGSLFSRVTYFAGSIAFRSDPAELRLLSRTNAGIPAELRNFDFSKLRPTRILEEVEATSKGRARRVILRTDLVPFPHASDSRDDYLLVYSVHDPLQGGARLITAFPVGAGFVKKLLSPENFGKSELIATRYNGFVDGITDVTIRGTRTLEKATDVAR